MIQLTLTLKMTAAQGAKRQSLSTTVLFKTTITETTMLHLIKSKAAKTNRLNWLFLLTLLEVLFKNENKWNFSVYSIKHNGVQKQLQLWLTLIHHIVVAFLSNGSKISSGRICSFWLILECVQLVLSSFDFCALQIRLNKARILGPS